MKIKEETNITLIGECMGTLIGETLSMAVLDSGRTKTVCSKTWLNCYLESLSSEELVNIKRERSETIFKFDNGKICPSSERIRIPVVIAGQNVLLTMDVIENDIPLLLSKDTMKKAKIYIDFAGDKIITLTKEVPVKFTTSGHYSIPIGKIDDNHNQVLKSESILFCDDVNEPSNDEKQKVAIKLHHQFSYPYSDKLIAPLKDAYINDKQLFNMANNISSNCKVWQKYKQPKPKPIVSFPLAKTFNETAALDLKEWKSNPKV